MIERFVFYRPEHNDFFLGHFDEYTPDAKLAFSFTEEELKTLARRKGETVVPLGLEEMDP